jgi:pyruvate,water dikinase
VLAGLDPDDPAAWQSFLERFGHLSDSPNDCSRPTWAEQSEEVRGVVGPGQGPRGEREAAAPAAATREELRAAVPALRRVTAARRWDRAARLRQLREEVGYSYARVYGLFRPTLLEAGRRLVGRGLLADRDDVFLLDLAELGAALRGDLPAAAHLVAERREEMAHAAELVFPEFVVGDDPMPVRDRAGARVLVGVPTAGGRHTGPARVVTSLASAGPIGPEDVLVLAAADVTWTPLLVRAGAVVTETGGMLAHASIVAREIGVPCVASVEGATRIPDGALVSVDGAAGEVILFDAPGDGAPDVQAGREE